MKVHELRRLLMLVHPDDRVYGDIHLDGKAALYQSPREGMLGGPRVYIGDRPPTGYTLVFTQEISVSTESNNE